MRPPARTVFHCSISLVGLLVLQFSEDVMVEFRLVYSYSCLLSKNLKIKIYKTTVLPVVLYGF